MGRDPQPITDWRQGDPTPPWTPVAGGKGFGGSSAGSGGAAAAAGNETDVDAGVHGSNGGGVQPVSSSSGNITSQIRPSGSTSLGSPAAGSGSTLPGGGEGTEETTCASKTSKRYKQKRVARAIKRAEA